MERARNYVELDLFASDEGRPRVRRVFRTTLRTLVLAVRGFLRDGAFQQASALSFDTVPAVVPLLVIAFATLRGLGAYDALLDGMLRPWLEHGVGARADQSTLREAFAMLLELGEDANLAALGFLGILLLLYLVVVLLATMEATLDQIFGVHRPRRWVRKATDYAAILFVIPFALSFATTAAQALRRAAWVAPMGRLLETAASLLAVTAAITFLYLVMPSGRVRVRSALYGGVVAGVLEATAFWAYTTFQIGAARYHVLYSGFAAIPLFLVFVFVTWIIVLFGAEIAAAHQSPRGFRWRIRHRDPSAATKRSVALAFALDIARAFVAGAHPPTLRALAGGASVPERFARDVLDDLVRAGVLVRAVDDGRIAYTLARDPSMQRVSDVLAAIDRAGDEGPDHAPEAVAEILASLDRAQRESEADLDLRALASG